MFTVFSMWTLTTALYQMLNNQAAAKATIPLIFLFYLCYDIAYTPLLVAYSIEILPFSIRAKGFAVMNTAVVLTLAFNQFINPIALDSLRWKYYIVYCAFLLFELAFVFFFVVETKGKTLEETAAIFDGQEKIDDLQHIATIVATQSVNARSEDHQLRQRSQRVTLPGEKSSPSDDDVRFGHDRPPSAELDDKDIFVELPPRAYTP